MLVLFFFFICACVSIGASIILIASLYLFLVLYELYLPIVDDVGNKKKKLVNMCVGFLRKMLLNTTYILCALILMIHSYKLRIILFREGRNSV